MDLRGTFAFTRTGELVLALATPCMVALGSSSTPVAPAYAAPYSSPAASRSTTASATPTLVRSAAPSGSSSSPPPEPISSSYCNRAYLDAIAVTAITPWRTEVKGIWIDANHIAFRVDWKLCRLDPLADDASSLVAQPWTISGTQWTPTLSEAQQILKLVEDATETETDLVRGGAAPSLEITAFEIRSTEGTGKLHAGGEDELFVKIANRGLGTAYRVIATTRSSIKMLHGRQLSFGVIKPGAEKIRKLRVALPASETAQNAMLVLVPAEGNGFTPQNLSRRIGVVPSKATPVLAVHCSIVGHTGNRPALDAGMGYDMHCTVDNTGTIAADVELKTSIAGGVPLPSLPQRIAPGKHGAFDIPFRIPPTLTIKSNVDISVTAYDRKTSRNVRTQVTGVVRKPGVCPPEGITRAEYNAKIAAMRAEVTAGTLTQAAFEQYDAELVACIIDEPVVSERAPDPPGDQRFGTRPIR